MHLFNLLCVCLFCLSTGATSENLGAAEKPERCVFADPDTPRTVKEHVTAVFECHSVNMGVDPKIWIEMGERKIEPTSGMLIKRKFEIDFSRKDNQKSLVCVCKDQHNMTKTSEPVLLNVQFSSTDISMMRHENDPIENQHETLICTTSSSNPPSKIRWYEEGTLRPNNHDPVHETGEYYGTKTTLRYTTSAFRRHEQPDVSCCIDGTNTKCVHWTAHVKYGPSTPTIRQDPDGIITDGDTVTLTCSSDADPTPDDFISWFLGDTQQQGVAMGNHSKLYLYSISKDDAGPYHCRANNHIEEAKDSSVINLKVNYGPEISSLKETCSNDEKTITLQCITQSLPNPVIQWYSPNGSRITDGVEVIVIDTDPFLGTKIQSDLTFSLESLYWVLGDYTCNVTNSVSTDTRSISVSDCSDSLTHANTIVLSVGGALVVIALFIITLGVCRHGYQVYLVVENEGRRRLLVGANYQHKGHGTFKLGPDEQNIGPISGEYADGMDPNMANEMENSVLDSDDEDEACLVTDGGRFPRS